MFGILCALAVLVHIYIKGNPDGIFFNIYLDSLHVQWLTNVIMLFSLFG